MMKVLRAVSFALACFLPLSACGPAVGDLERFAPEEIATVYMLFFEKDGVEAEGGEEVLREVAAAMKVYNLKAVVKGFRGADEAPEMDDERVAAVVKYLEGVKIAPEAVTQQVLGVPALLNAEDDGSAGRRVEIFLAPVE